MRITILKCICSFRLYSCALVCIYPCVYIRTVIYAKATNATTSRRNHNIRSISRCPYRYRLTTASSYRHRRNRFHSPPRAAVANLVSRPRSTPFSTYLYSLPQITEPPLPASSRSNEEGEIGSAFRSALTREGTRDKTRAEHYRLRFKRSDDAGTANGRLRAAASSSYEPTSPEPALLLTSSRRPDRQYRKRTGAGAGGNASSVVLLMPATTAISLGCAARRRNLAEARREHLPRRDVVVTRPRIDTAVFPFPRFPSDSLRHSARENAAIRRFRTITAASCVDQPMIILIAIVDLERERDKGEGAWSVAYSAFARARAVYILHARLAQSR